MIKPLFLLLSILGLVHLPILTIEKQIYMVTLKYILSVQMGEMSERNQNYLSDSHLNLQMCFQGLLLLVFLTPKPLLSSSSSSFLEVGLWPKTLAASICLKLAGKGGE